MVFFAEYDNLTYEETYFMLAGCPVAGFLLLKDVFIRQKSNPSEWRKMLCILIYPAVKVLKEKLGRIVGIIQCAMR